MTESDNNDKLAHACYSGAVSAALEILEVNKGLYQKSISWVDLDGKELSTPPIFIAIDYGQAEIVQKLLPMHKDVMNTLQAEGDYTILQWAAFAGHYGIVKLLINEGGAHVDEEALSLAQESDNNDIVDLLLEHIDLYSHLKDDDEIMEKACREGDVEKVRELLDSKYDVEKWKDEEGKWHLFSPMYLAVKNAHLEVVTLFAERGVQMVM